jgi:hypothetical protein
VNSTDAALAPKRSASAGSPMFDQNVGGLPSTASLRKDQSAARRSCAEVSVYGLVWLLKVDVRAA